MEKWHDTIAKKAKQTLTENHSDVIIVCAGGILPDGSPNPWVIKRLDACIALYMQAPRPILCLGGGTYHKPPALNQYGFVIHESSSCASYLLENGVQRNHIIKEWSSYDTIGNAWFAFTNYIVPFKWKTITVITSKFHMERVSILFNWVNVLYQGPCEMLFISSDNNMDSDILAVRSTREKKSCASIQKLKQKILNIKDFILWLYTEHNAYSMYEHVPTTDIKLKNSY
jgi:vancomycin permeability regulator SanA